MYLDKENTLYVKCTNGKTILNKRVTELPDGNITVYYNNLYDDYYEFAALLESKELYYVAFNINSKSNYKFKKVGEDITSVYVPTYDKNEVFVNRNNRFVTNFIFIEGDNNLDYLSYKNKEYSLNNSLQEVKPYFDYVCASDNFKICNDIMIYQTFEKKLVYGYSGNTIKNEFGEEIIVKDMFSIFEVNTKKDVNLDEISFRTLNKKYDYLFTVYVVSEEGVLYKLEINNNVMKKEGNISALTASDKKVKQLNYEEKDGEIGKIHIIYNDGKEEVILFSRNKSIITSTVYDKEKLKNKVLKVG